MRVLDSPPRRRVEPDPGTRPSAGSTVPASASEAEVSEAAASPAAAPARPPRTWPRRLAVVGLVVLTTVQLLTALGYLLVVTTFPQEIDLAVGPRHDTVGPPAVAPAPSAAPVAPVAVPVDPDLLATNLSIPKLKLRDDLVQLGVDAAGTLVPPDSPDQAGWFTGAAAPGKAGPTVIAGHVDSQDGPGVFYRLKDLARGDLVDIGRSDGQTFRYRVTGVETVDKDKFPTQQVYGPTPGAELRLITCGGTFDRVAGHYLRNVVVSGVLVDAD